MISCLRVWKKELKESLAKWQYFYEKGEHEWDMSEIRKIRKASKEVDADNIYFEPI